MEQIKQEPMPTFYIPHGGGPCFFMNWTMGPADSWDEMASFLKNLASSLSRKPKALLVVSAHWEEAEITINNGKKPRLLYDYYGFPDETYELEYNAAGAPELGERARSLLAESGIATRFNDVRGLDHGVFIPLKLVYPQADIPILQVSLKKGLDPAVHIRLGQALSPLREEDILIIGSGMSFHNLSHFGSSSLDEDSVAFDNWLNNTVCIEEPNSRQTLLSNWEAAPSARAAHPREEHLIPLMVAAGAGGDDLGKRIYSGRVLGSAYSGYRFG